LLCTDDDRLTFRSIDSIPDLIGLNEHCGKGTGDGLLSENFGLTHKVNM